MSENIRPRSSPSRYTPSSQSSAAGKKDRPLSSPGLTDVTDLQGQSAVYHRPEKYLGLPPDGTVNPVVAELPLKHSLQSTWEGCCRTFLETCVHQHEHQNSVHAGVFLACTLSSTRPRQPAFIVYLGKKDMHARLHLRMQASVIKFVTEHFGPKLPVCFYSLTLDLELRMDESPGHSDPGIPRKMFEIEESPRIGYSIGPSERGYTGSIGCFVRLIDTRTGSRLSSQFALTCHHVIKGRREDVVGKNSGLVVDCPAAKDLWSSKKSMLDVLSSREEKIASNEYEIRKFKYFQEMLVEPKYEERIETLQSEVDLFEGKCLELDGHVRRINDFKPRLGTVFQTSGIQFLPHGHPGEHIEENPQMLSMPMLIDWALIQVDEPRQGENIFPIEGRSRLDNVVWNEAAYQGPTATQSNVPKGSRVMKYGRSSQFTEGDVSDYRLVGSTIQHENYAHYYIKGCGNTKLFSKSGDSGAIVMDTKRRVVGMIVAGKASADDEQDRTFFIPWDVLESHIRDNTGYQMELIRQIAPKGKGKGKENVPLTGKALAGSSGGLPIRHKKSFMEETASSKARRESGLKGLSRRDRSRSPSKTATPSKK